MTRLPSMLVLVLVPTLACGEPPDASPHDASSGGSVGAEASTGGGSATSTTGRPPGGTSTTLDTTTGDGTTEDTGSVFIVAPDGGVCLVGGDGELQPRCQGCDVGLQDCPLGEKCVPWANDGGDAWNSTRCSPVPDDPAGLGEPCVAEASPVSGFDDCALGLSCFGVDPRTLQGTCVELCTSRDPEACGEDEVCIDRDGFSPYVCMPRCDPTDPATCAVDETCREIGSDLVCVPIVVLPQGLACNAEGTHCAPDEACRPADELARCLGFECCTPWCDLSAPDPDLPCSAVPGEVCRPYAAAPVAGLEHVGVCGLP
jgi:hypothetical protein